MNTPSFFIVISLLTCNAISQTNITHNYISNPGFEDNIAGKQVISGPSQLRIGRLPATFWYQPANGTPDYYNSDSSHYFLPGQLNSSLLVPKAEEGKCRMSIIAYAGKGWYKNLYSEYIQSQLKISLDSGKQYQLRFFLYFDSLSGFTASNFGALFTPDSIRSHRPNAFRKKPQAILQNDSALTVPGKWNEINLKFTSDGFHQFITIGSFEYNEMCPCERKRNFGRKTELQKFAYYHLDNLSLTRLPDSLQNNEKKTEPNPILCHRKISKRRFAARFKKTSLITLYATAVYGGAYLIYLNQKGKK